MEGETREEKASVTASTHLPGLRPSNTSPWRKGKLATVVAPAGRKRPANSLFPPPQFYPPAPPAGWAPSNEEPLEEGEVGVRRRAGCTEDAGNLVRHACKVRPLIANGLPHPHDDVLREDVPGKA